jgi:large conductance mechanosensitive channel
MSTGIASDVVQARAPPRDIRAFIECHDGVFSGRLTNNGGLLVNDFKAFVLRGNVVDLAVAVVIGVAFGAVVSSFVNNIIMPPVGKVTGGVDFASLKIDLGGGAAIKYGLFINALITFVIVAAVIFFVVMPMSHLRPALKDADPETKECPECLSEIPAKAKRCSACGQPQGRAN